jgi:protein MpaA
MLLVTSTESPSYNWLVIRSRVSQQLIAAVDSLGFPAAGRSTLGRPLALGRFGPPVGPALLIVGGVHGNEASSVAAAIELCGWLAAHPPQRPVRVMPVMNPDGVAAGTKNSATDVDLNRNFPARNFRVDHQPGYSPGPSPLSEPEARALAALVDDVTAVLAIHAPFACVNYDGPAAAWAEAIAQSCGWPARADIGYPTPGSLGSWLGIDRGLPIVTLELPAGEYEPFRDLAQAALQTAINPERIR